MGFKDVDWAYGLDLPMAQKVVLVAICHRADDKTHTTIVGQKTLAAMLGGSVAKVGRAVKELEAVGVISRESRHGVGGYRTSDKTVVNKAYSTKSLPVETPTRQKAHKENRASLPVVLAEPTGRIDVAEEVTQYGHSVGHSVNTSTNVVREDVSRLCNLLADLIEHNGSLRPTVKTAWTDSARLLLDKDGRDYESAEKLIRWVQADNFWRGNVMSMPKFREKYDQLRLSANKNSKQFSSLSTADHGRGVDEILRRQMNQQLSIEVN